MKASYFDIVFMVLLAAILLLLNAMNWLDAVMKLPFVAILIGYITGRYVTYLMQKKFLKKESR